VRVDTSDGSQANLWLLASSRTAQLLPRPPLPPLPALDTLNPPILPPTSLPIWLQARAWAGMAEATRGP